MKSLLSFLVCFITSYVVVGQSNSRYKYGEQLGRMMKRSEVGVYTMKYFTDVAKYTFSQISPENNNGNKFQSAIQDANTDLAKLLSDSQKIITNTSKLADRERIQFKTFEYASRMVMSPLESIPFLGPIQKEINNQIFQEVENQITDTYKRKLAYSLQKLKEQNIVKYNSIIDGGNYNEVKKALEEVNFFSTTEFSNVDEEFKEIIEKSQEKFLKETVKNSLVRVVTDLGNQQIEINGINHDISQLTQFSYKFAEESNKRFEQLLTSQQKLDTVLNNFYNKYSRDRKALDFMQNFLYSKMSTDEKIEALEAGILANIPKDERAKLEMQLKLEKEKKEVIKNAYRYLNAAESATQILKNLNLGDSKFLQKISEGINIGQTALSAYQVFLNGDKLSYLGAISSLTGLFAKGGDDIATSRHKQIMQRFDRIDESLNRIDIKVTELLQRQEEMLEIQLKTFEFLLEISKKVEEQHNEVMLKLEVLENAIYENRQLIMDPWVARCQACLETNEILGLDIDRGIFPNWNKLNSEYVNLKDGYFEECEKYLRNYTFRLDQPSVNPHFYLNSSLTNGLDSQPYRELINVNKLSFNLLFSYNSPVFKIKTPKSFLYSLFFPSYSIKELNQKINADSILIESDYYPTNPKLFENIIAPYVSALHGKVVRNIGFLFSLTDMNRNLISWEEFTSIGPPAHRNAIREIENAISLNNIAIAQQSILAGDILLPLIFSETYNFQSDSSDKTKLAICKSLLAQNDLLAANFTNYVIGAYLKETDQSMMQYGYAYNSKDSLTMSKVIKNVYPISYIKSGNPLLGTNQQSEGWYMTIGMSLYSLPHPTYVNKTPLRQSQSLPELIQNREKLIQQLFNYSIHKGETSQNLNYLLLKN